MKSIPSVFMYAMHIQNDVIGLVLRKNCKSKQMIDIIAWPSRCHGRIPSCYRFSCYYRFSDIAINSVNPPFIWRLEFSKNGYLNISLCIRFFLKPFLYFNILSITWQLLLSVKWRHLFPWQIKTRPIYGVETNIKSGNGWF